MSLGSAYEEEAITALAITAATPRGAPPAKFSAWRTLTGVVRGPVEAVAQGLATTAEAIGGFGQVLGAYPEAVGYSPTGQARQQADAARQKLLREGVDLNNDVGDSLREAGRSYRPDPVTSHTAEQLVYSFSRGATKVVGGAVLAGPIGVAGAGLEEGMSAADDLRAQGVGFGARSAAGAVQGAGLALAALPAAGQTAAATAGLFAVGGPGGFIAQQAATRQILENAGYDQIAAQYDPFDPVGLTVSTLLPAGFAAYGMRQAKLQRAVQTATLPEPVAPVVEASAPIPSRETPIAAAARAYPTEVVDAARVALLVERRAAANPGAPDNLRAMDLHEAAMARAEDQLAAGIRVDVADIAPPPMVGAVRALDTQISVLEVQRAELLPAAGNLAGRGEIAAVRREMALLEQNRPATDDASIKALAKDLKSSQRISYKAALSEARRMTDEAALEFDAKLSNLSAAIERNAEAQRATQEIAKLDGQIEDLKAQRAEAAPFAAFRSAIADAAVTAIRDLQTRTDAPTTPQAANPEGPTPPRGAGAGDAAPSAADAGRPAANLQAAGLTPAEGATIVADALRPVAPSVVDQIDSLLGRRATADAASADSTMARRVEMAQQQFPALEVMVDGMDKPMPLAEFMAAAKADADDLQADAPLMQIAAECALLNRPG